MSNRVAGDWNRWRLSGVYRGRDWKKCRSSAKNLIFASSVKPDLRFSDAINNDVEVVTNQDKVLIYDRQVGVGGLSWQELQDWWLPITISAVTMPRRASIFG